VTLRPVQIVILEARRRPRLERSPERPSSPETGWRVDLGGAVLAYPLYPGSKIERVLPIPSIEAHYGDRFFASVREGVGYNLFRWNGFEAGPVANFAFPRDESDKRAALKGLSPSASS
jgi:outer membrane protein